MNCNNCGNPIRQEDRVCTKCGKPVSIQSERFCENCGASLPADALFCGNCGESLPRKESSFCSHCGEALAPTVQFCPKCGAQNNSCVRGQRNENLHKKTMEPSDPIPAKNDIPGLLKYIFLGRRRCLPGFIVGLIGSIFGIFGAFCTLFCAEICSFGIVNTNKMFVLLFLGSIIGLIGACFCLSRSSLGAVCMLISTIMLIAQLYGGLGGDFASVIAMVLLITATIIAGVSSAIKIIRALSSSK